MPRGGKRLNSGRRGLSFDEKCSCAVRLHELRSAHLENRKRRAFGKMLRVSHRAGRLILELKEYAYHVAEVPRASPDVLRGMTSEERNELATNMRDYAVAANRNPSDTPISALMCQQGIPRVLHIPPPTDAELGAMYQQIAEEMTLRLGCPISRRQVAEACRLIEKA